MSEKAIIKEEIKDKSKTPKLYKVLLLNDNYTSMDFVVEVIVNIFNKTVEDATKIMLDVHNKNKGLVGIYSYDIATTKVARVMYAAEDNGFPLKAIIEEE